VQGVLAVVYLVILAAFAWLMISRRLSATLALPLAALALAVAALVPTLHSTGVLPALQQLQADVVEAGVARLSGAMFAVLLGAFLAALLRITGAAERVVRYAAEYAGEDRFRLAVMLLLVISLLFTSLGGLGAVIMVASITLPLMFSLGFEPKVAGALFLFGLSLGGCLNPVNWKLYIDVLGLASAQIIPFALVMAAIFFMVACAFLLVHLAGPAERKRQFWPLLALVLAGMVVYIVIANFPAVWLAFKHALAGLLLACLGGLTLLLLLKLVLLWFRRDAPDGWHNRPDNWLVAASVLVPLLLLLWSTLHTSLVGEAAAGINIGILAALTAGILFAALASLAHDGANANRVMKALFEGVAQGGPAIVLLIGIGLLLQATALPQVAGSFTPLLASLPLRNPFWFVVLFFVLSPLALYRGPLNLYGMGSGVVGIIAGSAILPAGLTLVAFFAVGMLQGVCDPTNTHNVWIANFCKVPVGELTRITLPWTLAIVLAGLCAGAVMSGGV
jgi:H+/gluconate symporter-like permease